jgi:tetratricopeptide (TPR) repeat protein/O-antigen ligase
MQTRLSLFCDKIIEAGWLAAAIVTPLFFNWYSNRVFEASKVALLRSIAVVMVAAWLIKILEAGSWKRKAGTPIFNIQHLVSGNPLLLPGLLLAAIYILTTITSIAPRVSFWGFYHRQQGLYVALCYIAIFFLMLDTLRTRQQLERLITVILLTSLPVSLYGIMQHYRIDPLVWIRTSLSGRVESTLGNPILIGAYLIMVVPLTVWQLIRSFSLIRTRGKKVGPSLVLFGCYLLLLILQLICLVFTQSRGPVMGLVAGALFSFLLLTVLRGRKGLALAAVGASIALLAILAILNLPNSPLMLPKGIPFVRRLGAMSRDIMEDRSLIWHGAAEMITADGIRAVIGYGPETMGLISHPYTHPDWAALKGYQQVVDRCHNETLDAWITSGLIGLFAYLVFFGSIFYHGFKQLGLITNSRQRTFFVVTCLAGGFSGALVSWLVEGTLRWAGVGIPAGILLALVIYLLTSLFRQSPKSNGSTELTEVFQLPTLVLSPVEVSNFQILLIILLSALVAHFVEIQFGIAITATRTYFWIYAALLAIIGCCRQEELVPEAAAKTPPPDISHQRRGRRRRGRRQKADRPSADISARLSGSTLPQALLVGLILATTSFDLITHQFELSANGLVISGLLFVIWLFGGILILTLRPGSGQASSLQSPISNLRTYVLGSLLCFLPFIVIHAAIILPGASVERAIFAYYAFTFSVIFAVAVALLMGSDLRLPSATPSTKLRTRPLYRFRAWWLYPVIGIGILLLILNTNLNAAQADVYYKFALSSEEKGEVDQAISVYSQAIQLAPHWSQYYASLGWAYGLKAVTASDADQRGALFEESVKTLEHARQMSPFDPDIMAKLGHVYWNWGSLTPDLGQKAEKLETALVHYEQAVTLSPLNHGRMLKDDMIQTYLHLGETYTAIDKLSQAAEAYQKAIEMAPDSYEGHKDLASVYLQLSRLDEALEEAKTARNLAPEEERSSLDDLIAQLEARQQ